jgi:nucleoside 2-deoxyribosyltransferase
MLNIIGGTYYEICREPHPQWEELFGSGLRAAFALSDKQIQLTFYTYCDAKTKDVLLTIGEQLSFNVIIKETLQSIEFFYDHPLKNPSFFPKLEHYNNQEVIKASNLKDVICFGMLEGNAIVDAKRVVYDPQRPEAPLSFKNNGSSAEELIMIMNLGEAKQLTSTNDLNSIADYLFNCERANAAIIKCGPDGAFLLEAGKTITAIPSYMTEKVWPIGSGDIFTSYFGYQWMIKNSSLYDSAIKASQAVAYYANSTTLPIPDNIVNKFIPFSKVSNKTKTVYLAGPFFSMSQRWVIHEFREALLSMNLQVFSPFHDVGIGNASEVAELDIEGINKCDLLLAIIDGLDSGTLFEIGYARAKGIPTIAYGENVPEGSLTMLEGTECIIEDDFSTCIYRVVWELYK